MSSRLIAPLVCFVLGSGLGGFMGRRHGHQAQAQTEAIIAGDAGTKTSALGGGESSDASRVRHSDPSIVSIIRTLDELLEEFDDNLAARFAAGLSIPEIQQALGYLQPRSEDFAPFLRGRLLSAWAKKDLEAAWKAALTLGDWRERSNALSGIVMDLARTDLDRAMDLAMSLGMSSIREHLLYSLIMARWERDATGVIAFLAKHPELPLSESTLGSLLREGRFNDHALALQQALALPNPSFRDALVSGILNRWQHQDSDSAAQWALALTDPVLRETALKSLIEAMTNHNDPKAAMQFMNQHGLSRSMSEVKDFVIYAWLQRDTTAAFDYLAANPQELHQVRGNLDWVLKHITTEEQESLLTRLSRGKTWDIVAETIARQHLSHGRYPQAVALLNELPDSGNRDQSLQQLGETWAKSQPQAAADWLRHQPDSTDRDLVIAGYALAVAASNPHSAIQWASTIPDARIQTAVFKTIAVRWLQSDPQNARLWLDGLALSQADKDTILKDARTVGAGFSYSISVGERRQ